MLAYDGHLEGKRNCVLEQLSGNQGRRALCSGIIVSGVAVLPRSFRILSAVVVVSLAAAYLALNCFRLLSPASRLGSEPRALATGGSDGNSCFDRPNGEESREVSNDDGRTLADPLGAPAGSEKAAGDSQGEAATAEQVNSLRGYAKGWGPWRMPFEWEIQVEGLLRKIAAAPTQCMKLLDFLDAEQGALLTKNMVLLAGVELSGFAYIPLRIQHMRQEAGAAYVRLIQGVLTTGRFTNILAAKNLRASFQSLQHFISQVSKIPQSAAKASDEVYKATTVSHWKLCNFTFHEIESKLAILTQFSGVGSVPFKRAEETIKIFEVLFSMRKQQLLPRFLIRSWLAACQDEVGVDLLFTPDEFVRFLDVPRQRPSVLIKDIQDATERALGALGPAEGFLSGSLATLSFAEKYESFPQPPGSGPALLLPREMRLSSVEEGVERPSAQQYPDKDLSPEELLRLRLPDERPESPSPQSSHQLDLYLQPSHQEVLSSQGSSVSSKKEVLSDDDRLRQSRWEKAEVLGWGRRRMPERWEQNIRFMLFKMESMAHYCVALLPLLQPQESVQLAVHLATFGAVQIAAFAYIPDSLQPRRAEVGMAYRTMVSRVLAEGSGTRSMAKTLKVEGRLVALRLVLDEVSSPPPSTDVISPTMYKRKMTNQYRVCIFACRRMVGFLSGLLSAHYQARLSSTRVQGVVKACNEVTEVLRMHLFGNSYLRYWLSVSQRKVAPYSVYSEDDYRMLSSVRMKKVSDVCDDIDAAIRKAGLSECLEIRGWAPSPPPVALSDSPPNGAQGTQQRTADSRHAQVSQQSFSHKPTPQRLAPGDSLSSKDKLQSSKAIQAYDPQKASDSLVLSNALPPRFQGQVAQLAEHTSAHKGLASPLLGQSTGLVQVLDLLQHHKLGPLPSVAPGAIQQPAHGLEAYQGPRHFPDPRMTPSGVSLHPVAHMGPQVSQAWPILSSPSSAGLGSPPHPLSLTGAAIHGLAGPPSSAPPPAVGKPSQFAFQLPNFGTAAAPGGSHPTIYSGLRGRLHPTAVIEPPPPLRLPQQSSIWSPVGGDPAQLRFPQTAPHVHASPQMGGASSLQLAAEIPMWTLADERQSTKYQEPAAVPFAYRPPRPGGHVSGGFYEANGGPLLPEVHLGNPRVPGSNLSTMDLTRQFSGWTLGDFDGNSKGH
ncbi:hypothetical protein Efla_006083 [Eimeria flavescens]